MLNDPGDNDRSAVLNWLTRGDRGALLQRQPELHFAGVRPGARPTIQVDPARRRQALDGFGFALTGGSAELIAGLPPAARDALLHELFAPDGDGIRVSLLRVSIGASDLSRTCFSYDDLPAGAVDPELERFDLAAGDREVVPVLQAIRAINPALRIIASPWSAPAWMKSNGDTVGGALRPEFYHAYAAYFVKYLQAMRAHGIVIHAVTVQNEPENPRNQPSMVMTAAEQAEFIKHHLGPALRAAGLGEVELFCWDHNCDHPEYPLAILADRQARAFVAGVAWHLYAGDIGVLAAVQQAHPDKKMYFTEQWVGDNGRFDGDLRWHVRNVVVGSLRHGSRAVLEWNLASDPFCGPHTPGGEPHCVGALTIGDEVARNVAYYIIGHVARFVPPGSVRVDSSLPDTLPNVAFATADGRGVLLVLNDGDTAQPFDVRCGERVFTAELGAGDVATYRWAL